MLKKPTSPPNVIEQPRMKLLAPWEQGLCTNSPAQCTASQVGAGSDAAGGWRQQPHWGWGWLCALASDSTGGMARDCTVPVILKCYCRSQSKFESSPEAASSLYKRTVRENSYYNVCVSKRKKNSVIIPGFFGYISNPAIIQLFILCECTPCYLSSTNSTLETAF